MPLLNLSLQKNQTLSRKIYKLIKNSIIKGSLEPGERLVIEKIANEIGVSTTPVRDALQQLIYAGYAVKKDNSSIFVIELSKEDILEIFDIREVLEGLAARLLAENVSDNPKKGELLKKLMKQFKDKKIELVNKKGYISHNLDVRLHNLLLDLSSNKGLKKQVNKIMNQSYRIREMQHQSKIDDYLHQGDITRMLREIEEHIEIIETILSGDGKSAENKMREHIQHSKKDLIEWVNIPEW